MASVHLLLLWTALLVDSTVGALIGKKVVAPRVTGYVEYLPGTGLNVILSAPHDGDLTPTTIPDRVAGCWDGSQCIWSHTCGTPDTLNCAATTVKDENTGELGHELRQVLCDRFSVCPGLVVNLLRRTKLDPNREIEEATFGVQEAIDVYNEYHSYIETERDNITGMGLYIDLHGHGHELQRAELGYLVSGPQLDSGDPIDPETTSIRSLAGYVGGDFDQLLRDLTSFGDFLETEGFAAVPSPANPGPNGNLYFSGGYSTQVHGSRDGGQVDAIQIESPWTFLEPSRRSDYVIALTNTIVNYLAEHYPPTSK